MPDLLSPDFVLEPVTKNDLIIASLAWGFTLGFGWLTTWTAIRQTRRIWRRYGSSSIHNTYIWMVWLEIVVSFVFSVICWLYLNGTIPPSFVFYLTILTCWALQVQFLLQIIINRCAILMPDRKTVWRLKFGVAFFITIVNITVYTIWVPARLHTSERYIWVNSWWDRCEKGIYLLVDGALNVFFILIVKRSLIQNGLPKYKRLTNFNIFIICFSLSMDVLIISMMSLSNTFVYMQFHPLAYMVKLNIEMSMADLIAKVARKPERLPTIQVSPHRRVNLSSSMRSFTRTTSQVQPLPPARNAVPFRVWSASNSVGVESTAGSNLDGSQVSQVSKLSQDGAVSSRGTLPPGELDTCGPWDAADHELYMVQEVTVESEAIDVGLRRYKSSSKKLDDSTSQEERLTPPIIWDGGTTPVSTSVVASGPRV